MRIKIDLEIKPFSTPNCVIPVQKAGLKQDGYNPTEGISLRDIDEGTLSNLCDQFRKDIFKKAEKKDPRDK